MPTSIGELASAIRSQLNNLSGTVRVLALTAIAILATFIAFWIANTILAYFISRSYVDEVAAAFDLNKSLATAITLAAFAVTVFFLGYIFSFSKAKRRFGLVGVLSLLLGQSLVLWVGTRSEIIDREGRATKCYVITRDGVTYRERAGIDPASGRQCVPVTPEVVEKLRQYERGNRPKLLDEANDTFFDPGTGRPIVWYFKDKNGSIQIFDLMGFHPATGDELLPITKDVVDLWKQQAEQRKLQRNRRTPERVDIEKYSPFDPITGEPRTWYWRSDKGEYEFYNAPGFHSRTGDALTLFTKEAIAKFIKESEALQKAQREEQQRQREERQRRAEKEDQERREQLARTEQERRDREAARDKATQAARLCDQLAANPNDPKRAGAGAAFEVLHQHAKDAIEACEAAIQQDPNELRFQYQLGRALQFSNRQKAFEIHKKLASLKYPAAFDNLGWIYYTDRKNIPEAANQFRLGAELGDPDAMVSLAELIERGETVARTRTERFDLLSRAANLGHEGAARAIQSDIDKQIAVDQERTRQLENTRRALDMLNGFMQAMPRR